MRGKVGRADVGIGPYGGVTRGAAKRAVGEIGEALPVAEEARRFRGSAPIGGHDSGRESVGTTVGNRRPYEILRFVIFPGENFLRQGDSVISRLFSSGLPSTMGETKEGIA